MVIRKTLRHALAKLFMRVAGYQENTACGNLQMCAGRLKAGIERETHAVGERRREIYVRRREEESGYGVDYE